MAKSKAERGRFSSRKKMDVVLRVLRGDDLDLVSREAGITAATSAVTDGAVTVFIGVDHCTLEGIGIHAAKRATRFEALEPIRQGVRQQFGVVSAGIATGLQVRHDHGSQ